MMIKTALGAVSQNQRMQTLDRGHSGDGLEPVDTFTLSCNGAAEPNAFYDPTKGMYYSDGKGSSGYLGLPAGDPESFQKR